MIKKLLGLFFVLFIYGNISAQDLYKANPRLAECLNQDYITSLENTKSELIPYYNYYLDNSYYVVNLKTTDKEVTGIDIHTVQMQMDKQQGKTLFNEKTYNKETFNAMKYQYNLSMNSFTTYIWKEAGIAIVFYPLSHISANFKEYMKSQTK